MKAEINPEKTNGSNKNLMYERAISFIPDFGKLHPRDETLNFNMI